MGSDQVGAVACVLCAGADVAVDADVAEEVGAWDAAEVGVVFPPGAVMELGAEGAGAAFVGAAC